MVDLRYQTPEFCCLLMPMQSLGINRQPDYEHGYD